MVKILKIIALITAGFIMSSQVQAQNLGLESSSYEEFVREHNVEKLNAIDTDNEVYCGNTETKCKRSTQICLRCSYYKSTGALGLGSKGYVEAGRCFPRPTNKHPENLTHRELQEMAQNFCIEADTEISGSRVANVVGGIKSFLVGNTKVQISYEKNGFIGARSVRLGLFLKFNLSREKFCEVNDSSKCYKLIYDSDNNASLAYASSGQLGKNIARGCEVLPIKIHNMKNCFFCPLSKIIFESANAITQMSFESFSQSFMRLMVMAFAVWLAFTSLQIVFTYTKQDGNKYLSGIIAQAGKFLLAYILLKYPDELFSLFISPILQAGIDMSEKLLPSDVRSAYSSTSSEVGGDYFDANNLYEKIENFLANVQQQLSAMQAIGSSLFCVGGHQMMTKLGEGWKGMLNNISYGIQMMLLGLVLFIFAFILTISFAFYFLDALLQLAILGAMLPFMIAGWPFKVTATYSKSGFGMLLNTFFTLFFTAFVVTVELHLIDRALAEINTARFGEMNQEGTTGLSGLFNAINEQNTKKIQDIVSIGGLGFLLLIFASLFGFKFVKETPKIVNKLAGGTNLGISSKIGTMGASAATGAAKKVTKPVREMASEKYHERGGLMGGAGRLLQAPAKLASRFKQSAAGKFISNTAFGRGVSKVKNSVQGFGTKIGQKMETFGDQMLNKGDANIHTDKAKGIISGAGQKALGRLAKGLGGGIHQVSQEGVLNTAGQRIEKFAKTVHKEFSDAEKRATDYDRKVNKFREKYGRDPRKGEI